MSEPAALPDIRDLKPLEAVSLGVPSWVYWAVGAAVVASLLLLAWWWRRKHQQRRALAAPPRPADELALERIAELRELLRRNPTEFQRAYFDLSEALRVYLEARFELNATDLTTDEILLKLADVRGLETGPRESLRAFLLDTDRVKFSAYAPADTEVTQILERAEDLVRATRPPPSAAPAKEHG